MAGSDESLKVVFSGSRNEAEIVRGVLESAEIPTAIGHSGAGAAYGINTGPLGQSSVSVPADRVEEARSLLGEPHPQETEVGPRSRRTSVVRWAAIVALVVSGLMILGPAADALPR